MRALLVVLLLVTVVYGATLNGQVKREVNRCYMVNEVYTACGSSCPKTCDSAHQTSPTSYCPPLCVPGCFCQEGFVRNRWGNCIPLDKCPCHEPDEVYTCDSACQLSCDTLDQMCPTQTNQCMTACRCRDGFARDKSGLCIPINTCPQHNLP